MKLQRIKQVVSILASAVLFVTGVSSIAAESAPSTTVPVTITVTANVASNKRMPELTRNDIAVRQGHNQLQVNDWVPARGDRAGLELFILIDDSADARVALQYGELRDFINAQPASTLVGVGYMRNAIVEIAQNPTSDHGLAARALRLPLGNHGAYGSPYLSAVDLMGRWPVSQNRHEIVLITDGVGRKRLSMPWPRGYHTDADADTAIAVAQQTGTNIFSIFAPGAPHFRNSYWARMNGQMNMDRLSMKTGGTSFYLGLHGPVTIQPYLAQLQTILDNQYLLSFSAKIGKKSGFQAIDLGTEVAGVNLAAYNAVWVEGAK